MYVTSARSKPYKVFSLFCGIYEIQSTDMYHDITTLSFRTLLWTNTLDVKIYVMYVYMYVFVYVCMCVCM